MFKCLWPALAGLFFVAAVCAATPDMAGFSHDAALAHSQAAIGRSLQGITLTAEDGSTVQIEDYRGQPLVISMIFTSCHHICPTTTQNLQEVVAKARKALDDDSFRVVTIGFDTANDNPERMAQFRRENNIDDEHWQFLSGDSEAITELTQQLGFIFAPAPRGFDHLIQASVVDAKGTVFRQVYGIEFPTPMLIEPLKELVFGEPANLSTLDYLQNRIRLFCTVYDPATDNYHIDISVFIGTIVGLIVSIIFGSILIREWRRSIKAGR